MFLLAELAVAVAGWGLQINPFDQPNVQQAKDATNRVLAGYETDARAARDRRRRRRGAARAARRRRAAQLRRDHGLSSSPRPSSTRPPPSCARRSARATKATTTFGYGPRFLHSTGQFHKGGPKTGRFLQLLHDGPEDVEIPGEPYTFTTLKNAQAIGDLETLRELGAARRARAPAGEDPAQRAARTHREDQGDAVTPKAVSKDAEDAVTQIGFVGLGKMGGNMVHRIRRDSEHEVVAFDFDEKAVKQAVKHGASGAASLKELVKQLQAPRMVWIMVPAGEPTQETVDKLAKLLERGRHDRRRRQLEVDRRQAPRGGTEKARHRLRRRRHLRRRVGPGGRLLHDGRRPTESGQAAGADPRRARAGDQRAERRGDRPARLAALRRLRARGTT